MSDAERVLCAGWHRAVGAGGPAEWGRFAALQYAALHDYLKEQGEEGMSWGKKMHTPESAKGMFDGRTKASLRAEQSRLRSKETRTAAEQKRLRRVNFALRAKNDFGKAK